MVFVAIDIVGIFLGKRIPNRSSHMTTHPKYAIVVAGGSGTRMGGPLPKQFLCVGNRPILMRTLERLVEAEPEVQLILVLPAAQFDTWQQLCQTYGFALRYRLVSGCDTRFQSVRNGLMTIPGHTGLVAVHDGVRPFVSLKTIRQSFEVAARRGSAVAAIPSKDSLRLVDEYGHTQALRREAVRLVQTPQTFRVDLLKAAFEQEESPNFTDDASVIEAAGFAVQLIEGSYYNLKITTPEDMVIAEAFLGSTVLSI